MHILYKSQKFEGLCTVHKKAVREFGSTRAKLLFRRINELAAAPRLEDMRNMPGRTHELKGDRAGQVSIDLDGPYRLLFEPEPPATLKDDGGLDWTMVETIILCEVTDPHD